MKRFLSAAEVLELAELLEEEPLRIGVVDKVLQAAAERRGMTLILADTTAGGSSRGHENRYGAPGGDQ